MLPLRSNRVRGRQAGGRPRSPDVISRCSADARRRLEQIHACAYLYAKAASLFLDRLSSMTAKARSRVWNQVGDVAVSGGYSGAPQYWFGPYADTRFRFIRETFRLVVRRFEKGFDFGNEVRPVRFLCLPGSGGRCRGTLLANASIYGTVRVCPRALQKPVVEGGLVILHEFLHQELMVGDQRDRVCRSGEDPRCYREGARRLVQAGKYGKAIRNNDNYAYFARGVYFAQGSLWISQN